MRPVDDKPCYASSQDSSSTNSSFKLDPLSNGNSTHVTQQTVHKSRTNTNNPQNKLANSRSKPTPSKWDDAQKWLVGLSNNHNQNKTKPRNSNADDRRLLASLSQNGRNSCSSLEGAFDYNFILPISTNGTNGTTGTINGTVFEEGETKKMDCESAVRSICLRDMGTEMTPIASKEPSRTGTPLRASTPVMRSPISSRSSSPRHEGGQVEGRSPVGEGTERIRNGEEMEENKVPENDNNKVIVNSLESRAIAWDEAEKAKYMARYKREEVTIQAWENHEKRKAESELKKIEVKAERMKARAQEKLANKLASTRRMAEEKRTNAEAKLNERASKTSERADYIRRTGHLPSSFFSFRLPSLCG